MQAAVRARAVARANLARLRASQIQEKIQERIWVATFGPWRRVQDLTADQVLTGLSKPFRHANYQESFCAISGDVLQITGNAVAPFPVFLCEQNGVEIAGARWGSRGVQPRWPSFFNAFQRVRGTPKNRLKYFAPGPQRSGVGNGAPEQALLRMPRERQVGIDDAGDVERGRLAASCESANRLPLCVAFVTDLLNLFHVRSRALLKPAYQRALSSSVRCGLRAAIVFSSPAPTEEVSACRDPAISLDPA